MNSYWFAARPSVEHGHPFLVFDCQNRLHLPLTMFGKEASVRVSPKTAVAELHGNLQSVVRRVQVYCWTPCSDVIKPLEVP